MQVVAVECAVIGAGPAGLTAATYLARFRRNTKVFDAGSSRAELIPASHNYPGMGRRGITGPRLLHHLRRQARQFGADIVTERVAQVQQHADGFLLKTGSGDIIAQRLLLATGIEDKLPPNMSDLSSVRAGRIRLCSICDGFETQGKHIAVYGAGCNALTHALFMRTFTERVTAVLTESIDTEDVRALSQQALDQHIDIVNAHPENVKVEDDKVRVVDSVGEHEFDFIYPVFGTYYRLEMIREMNVQCAASGAIIVDNHGCSSVPGLYAAGDVVDSANQICIAIGEAAQAAIAIHNSLPTNPIRAI